MPGSDAGIGKRSAAAGIQPSGAITEGINQ
jgi:hypothetical protein